MVLAPILALAEPIDSFLFGRDYIGIRANTLILAGKTYRAKPELTHEMFCAFLRHPAEGPSRLDDRRPLLEYRRGQSLGQDVGASSREPRPSGLPECRQSDGRYRYDR